VNNNSKTRKNFEMVTARIAARKPKGKKKSGNAFRVIPSQLNSAKQVAQDPKGIIKSSYLI